MLLGCIADDSTGASDLANTLAKGGMRTVQFIGTPDLGDDVDCEAGVVALKTRSIAPAEAVAQSLEALERLVTLGCRQILFKICSTFDSTPQGNIGPVAEALAARLGAPIVPVCPAFPGAGRTVYQGHLFVGDKLLSKSGMENHPLNPMTDSDIRRWLALQASGPVGHVPLAAVRGGAASIRLALDRAVSQGGSLVICDAVSDDDLKAIGEASAELPLLVGGSGIALGLPANFARAGALRLAQSVFSGVGGPGCVLAGSCSTATLGQIAEYSQDHPSLAVDVRGAVEDPGYGETLLAFMRENLPGEPLVHSSAPADTVREWQAHFGAERVAHALEQLFGALAGKLVEGGVRRLVIAGGETSGAVVTALGAKRLAIGPEIDPGVPALKVEGAVPLALALKSGNFGARDFFAKALAALGPSDGG